jgi:hypothetical protein
VNICSRASDFFGGYERTPENPTISYRHPLYPIRPIKKKLLIFEANDEDINY